MLTASVEEARSNLSKAAKEVDLESAKSRARRAKSSLEDAAFAALDCGCSMSSMEFDDAASRARRARDAGSGAEFAEQLNRAIRNFNSAIEALRICR